MKTYLNLDKNINCIQTADNKLCFKIPVINHVYSVTIFQLEIVFNSIILQGDFIEFYEDQDTLYERIEIPDQILETFDIEETLNTYNPARIRYIKPYIYFNNRITRIQSSNLMENQLELDLENLVECEQINPELFSTFVPLKPPRRRRRTQAEMAEARVRERRAVSSSPQRVQLFDEPEQPGGQTGGVWPLRNFKFRMLFQPKLNVIDIGKYFFLKIEEIQPVVKRSDGLTASLRLQTHNFRESYTLIEYSNESGTFKSVQKNILDLYTITVSILNSEGVSLNINQIRHFSMLLEIETNPPKHEGYTSILTRTNN